MCNLYNQIHINIITMLPFVDYYLKKTNLYFSLIIVDCVVLYVCRSEH